MTAKVIIDGDASGVVDAAESAEKAVERLRDEKGRFIPKAKQAAEALDDVADASEGAATEMRDAERASERAADGMDRLREEAERAAQSTEGLGGSVGGVTGAIGGRGSGMLGALGTAGVVLGGATLAIGALRGAMDLAWESTERFFQSQGREDLWEQVERNARRYTGTLFEVVIGTDDADEAAARLNQTLDDGMQLMDAALAVIRPFASVLSGVLRTGLSIAAQGVRDLTGDIPPLVTQLREAEQQARDAGAAAREMGDEMRSAFAGTLTAQINQQLDAIEQIEQQAAARAAEAALARVGAIPDGTIESARAYEAALRGITQAIRDGDERTQFYTVRTAAGLQRIRVAAGETVPTLREALAAWEEEGASALEVLQDQEAALFRLYDQRAALTEAPPLSTPAPDTSAPERGGGAAPSAAGPLDAAMDAAASRVAAAAAAAEAQIAEIEAKRQRISTAAQESKLRDIEADRIAEEERIRIAREAADERIRIAEEEQRRADQLRQSRIKWAQSMSSALTQIDLRSAESAIATTRMIAGQELQTEGAKLVAMGIGNLIALNPLGALQIAGGGAMIAAGRRIASGGSAGATAATAAPAAVSAPVRPVSRGDDVRYSIVNSFGIVGDERRAAQLVANSVRTAQREGMLQ